MSVGPRKVPTSKSTEGNRDMAYYKVIHKCGHAKDHNLLGTNVRGERERRAEWLAGRDCTDCWQTTESVAASLIADALNLPALTGTDRQIPWGEQKRLKAIDQLATRRAALRSSVLPGRQDDLWGVLLYEEAVEEQIQSHTDAHWWINNTEVDIHRAALQLAKDRLAAGEVGTERG
jgi:hypothetical protein